MNNRGFTLIEILVAVLIIGVLAAIAVPIYNTAVDKAFFTDLNATAKNLSKAQEVFYLGKGYYTENLPELDINLEDENLQKINTSIGNQEQYSYVKTSRAELNNNCVHYLKNSKNFPGEIHCEALKDDERATRLCTSLGGKRIPGSLTNNYTTYVLVGTGEGVSSSIVSTMSNVQCTESENSGNKSCEVVKYEKSTVKTVCTKKNDPKTCKYYIYDQNANTWECDAGKSKLVNGVCIPTGKGTYLKRWDEDGNRIEMQCDNYDTTKNACTQLAERTYDANSTKIEADRRYCEEYDENGACLSYAQNQGYDSYGTLNNNNSNNSLMSYNAQAGTFDYANATTHWAQVNCATIDENGVCVSYTDGWFTTSRWDENRREIYKELINCSSVTPDKQCAEAKSYTTLQGSYYENGKLNTLSIEECNAKDSSGNCTSLKATKNYTYNGTATKATSEWVDTCANTACTSYKPTTNKFRTFATDGTTQTSYTEVKCNSYTGTNCTGGWKVVFTPIDNGVDDVAHRETINNCQNLNMQTGRCLDAPAS